MFHLEVRQFPHVARAYNLTDEQLDGILTPWLQGVPFELQDRRWAPGKAKLLIYEGRALELSEIGMGRGWSNVTRTGADVTDVRLAAARTAEPAQALEQFKAALLARAAERGMRAGDAIEVARGAWPELEAEELATVSARAIWQLLAEGRLVLRGADQDSAEPDRHG